MVIEKGTQSFKKIYSVLMELNQFGTLKIHILPKKKPRRKVFLHQKGNFELMRKDASDFAKDKYFNGYSDNRSVQENFDLITSFIQESAEKHIPSKTSRSCY